MKWTGHILRMSDSKTVEQEFRWEPSSTRSRGRPKGGKRFNGLIFARIRREVRNAENGTRGRFSFFLYFIVLGTAVRKRKNEVVFRFSYCRPQ